MYKEKLTGFSPTEEQKKNAEILQKIAEKNTALFLAEVVHEGFTLGNAIAATGIFIACCHAGLKLMVDEKDHEKLLKLFKEMMDDSYNVLILNGGV